MGFVFQGARLIIAVARRAVAVAAGPASGSGLLLESPADSFLILESGDFLLLE